MLTKYLAAAMNAAQFEPLEEGGYFGSIPGLDGVWSSADSIDECRGELEEVLEDWLLFRLSRQLPIPAIQGIELAIRELA
jgi:predicted RNase H-like HicB family nuclease